MRECNLRLGGYRPRELVRRKGFPEVRAGIEYVARGSDEVARVSNLLSAPEWPAAESSPSIPSVSVSTPAVFEASSGALPVSSARRSRGEQRVAQTERTDERRARF